MKCVRCLAYDGINLERIGDHDYALCNYCKKKTLGGSVAEVEATRTVRGLARFAHPLLIGRRA